MWCCGRVGWMLSTGCPCIMDMRIGPDHKKYMFHVRASTGCGERIWPSEKNDNADGSDNVSGGCVYQVQITGCFIVICLERRLPNMNLLTLQI